jgi:hypothetical protein
MAQFYQARQLLVVGRRCSNNIKFGCFFELGSATHKTNKGLTMLPELPRTREEFTHMALVYNFDFKENGLYGHLCTQLTEHDEFQLSMYMVSWLLESIDKFPDLITYHVISDRISGEKLVVYAAAVFVFVLVADKAEQAMQALQDKPDHEQARNCILAIQHLDHVVRARCRKQGEHDDTE